LADVYTHYGDRFPYGIIANAFVVSFICASERPPSNDYVSFRNHFFHRTSDVGDSLPEIGSSVLDNSPEIAIRLDDSSSNLWMGFSHLFKPSGDAGAGTHGFSESVPWGQGRGQRGEEISVTIDVHQLINRILVSRVP
jgi:hypothetical protein